MSMAEPLRSDPTPPLKLMDTRLVRLVPILLQLLLKLLRLTVADLYRVDRVVCLFQLDRTVSNILDCGISTTCGKYVNSRKQRLPSISFQAFRKSSGSEKATNPNFA